MPRRARKDLSASFFHVIVQGLNKEFIFIEDEYKRKYLKLLESEKENYELKIIAYTIMNNHTHIIIYSKKNDELSKFMKRVNESYARFYNYKKNRVGYVFRDRFLSEPINNQNYLLHCISYIHNNPVKAGLVNSCENYKFSSYNDYINKSGFINGEIIKLVFGNEKLDYNYYKDIHSKKYYLLEYEQKVDENIKEIINEFQQRYVMDWKQILKEIKILEKIIPEIKERITISDNRLAKYMKISRYRLRQILIKGKR